MLDDHIVEIESELALKGILKRVYRRDASKPEKPLLLDELGYPHAGWVTRQIYPVVQGLLKPEEVDRVARASDRERWYLIKSLLGPQGIARLHSRLFLGPPPPPPPDWVVAYCLKHGLDPAKI